MIQENILQSIERFIEDNRDLMVSRCKELVAIPSMTEDREQVSLALDYVLDLGLRMGLKTKSLLNGEIGLVEAGEGEEILGVLAHVDVVDPGDESKWISPPFEPEVREGKLYGRGTLDDKGAVIAVMTAMEALVKLGIPLNKEIQLILGTREETHWTDMEAYVEKFPLPDYGFTPDGSFPICNVEKGGMDLELIIPLEKWKPQGKKAVLESVEAGKAVNVVPGVCQAVLKMPDGKEKQLETKGRSVHSCQPEKGINALVEMGKQIRSMLESGILEPTKGVKFLAMLGNRFESTEGEDLGLYSETEYYQGEFVHRNVFSPTLAYTSGQEIHVNINVRFPYGSDEEKIRETFRNLAEEFGGLIEEKGYMPAVYVRKDRPFLKAFDQAYERVMGESGGYNLEYGGTYAKAIPDVVSWGPIFPGEEDTCHEENEYIGVDSLVKNAKIFALAMANIALTEVSFR